MYKIQVNILIVIAYWKDKTICKTTILLTHLFNIDDFY